MELADPDSQVSAPVQPAPQRTRLSTAERQAIIERLIAEKRRNKLPDTVGTVQQSESQPQPQPQPQSQPLTEYDLNSQSDFASSRTSVTERESLEGIDRSSAKRRERKSITIPDSVPLFDRSMKWQKDRENELEKLRLEREKMEIESCSFKPQTSRGSTTTPVAPITERLYQVLLDLCNYILTHMCRLRRHQPTMLQRGAKRMSYEHVPSSRKSTHDLVHRSLW